MTKRTANEVMQVWIMEENDLDPTKLYVVVNSDADDALREAAKSDDFVMKQPRLYTLQYGGELLRRDEKLTRFRTSFDVPFVIVKLPQVDAHEYGKQVKKYRVRPCGDHNQDDIKYLSDATSYTDFIRKIQHKVIPLPNFANLSQVRYKNFVELVKPFKMQPNELSLTTKITFYLMGALQATNYVVSPFVHLNVPEARKGHPFMTDILIEAVSCSLDEAQASGNSSDEAQANNNSSDETPGSSNTNILTLTDSNIDSNIIAVIEVKKGINGDVLLVEPKFVIEMLLYVQYLMALHEKDSLIGMITDGTSWHCMQFSSASNSKLSVNKFLSFEANQNDMWIIPEVLKLLA